MGLAGRTPVPASWTAFMDWVGSGVPFERAAAHCVLQFGLADWVRIRWFRAPPMLLPVSGVLGPDDDDAAATRPLWDGTVRGKLCVVSGGFWQITRPFADSGLAQSTVPRRSRSAESPPRPRGAK